MKKSMVAIVLLGAGITFASAQKKESAKMQKATKIEAVQKAEVKAEMQPADSMNAEAVEMKAEDQKKVEDMEMMKAEDAKATEKTLNTQSARKESIE